MKLSPGSTAGVYAEQRYRRGLGAYRRRMRRPLLLVVGPIAVAFWAVALTRKLDPWSLAAGALLSAATALVMFVRDDAPSYVTSWRRGAEGERRTARILRRLERRGWSVEHDIQREGRANLDHVVRGPRGVFLLETKNLLGAVSFEDGCLVVRQLDDPDEVHRYRALPSRVRGQAMELSARIARETGRRSWVHAVVVVWGDFSETVVEHERVTYVRGDTLVRWLEHGAG